MPAHTPEPAAPRLRTGSPRLGRVSARLFRASWLVPCLVSMAQASPADRCQANPACRSHADKGVALSERKLYSLALGEFQAAYAVEPAPLLLLNIGRSLHRLERYQEALDRYAQYRREVPRIEPDTEQSLRRYEVEALAAMSSANQIEPPPAPLNPEPERLPPKLTFALFGAGLGLLIVGIGLGGAALGAAGELSAPSNNFRTFGTIEQGLERRGMQLQTAGQVFDVLGSMGLVAGAASLSTWWLLRAPKAQSAQRERRWARLPLLPSAASLHPLSVGGP